MRKVLIPTDFTVESLQLVEYAILNFPDTKLHIILIAGHRLPDARWAISHYSASEQIHKQFDDKFIDAKRRLLLEHKNNICRISFELFTGTNSIAFWNFLEPLGAEDAVVPKDKCLHGSSYKWFDPTRFLRKNVKNVVEVPLEQTEEIRQRKISLINFFNL